MISNISISWKFIFPCKVADDASFPKHAAWSPHFKSVVNSLYYLFYFSFELQYSKNSIDITIFKEIYLTMCFLKSLAWKIGLLGGHLSLGDSFSCYTGLLLLQPIRRYLWVSVTLFQSGIYFHFSYFLSKRSWKISS